jgi:CDP-diacylglycerol--serine O-phosphatidyltransferase
MNSNKAMYILPNLVTASSIFAGFLSILYTTKQDFTTASYLILISMVLDGLDGRVARLTNTQSRFGLEFDSLADTVSFCVAPAVLVYFFVGNEFGRIGILLSSLYLIFGTIRLAKFNISTVDSSIFLGLPTPLAALYVVSIILFIIDYNLMEYKNYFLYSIGIISFLMISNIRYPSFKKTGLSKADFTKVLIVLISGLSLFYIYPLESMLIFISSYISYGIVKSAYNIVTRKILRK